MLICRENLTLAAYMRLPDKMTWRQKFERRTSYGTGNEGQSSTRG